MSLNVTRAGLTVPDEFGDDDDTSTGEEPGGRSQPGLAKRSTARMAFPTIGTQKKKMLPAPFDEGEQKKAADGRAYYSNAKLRKTQWVHPATNTHQAGGRHQV
jgi:hypothetical protein